MRLFALLATALNGLPTRESHDSSLTSVCAAVDQAAAFIEEADQVLGPTLSYFPKRMLYDTFDVTALRALVLLALRV